MNLLIMLLGLVVLIVVFMMPGDQIAAAMLGGALFMGACVNWRDERKMR